MGILEQMITLLGGTTVAIAALAWLAKSLMGHLLEKDVEQHKDFLRAQTDAELEKLRAVLERESLEHEVKFRRIDDRVAEHLGQIYARLGALSETPLGDAIFSHPWASVVNRPRRRRRLDCLGRTSESIGPSI